MSDLQVEARDGRALCIPGVVQVIQIYLLSSCPKDRPEDLLVFASENSGASAGRVTARFMCPYTGPQAMQNVISVILAL